MDKLHISLASDMLNQLKLMHESMELQTNLINEASEKFNYALLQIESHRNVDACFRKPDSQILCLYNKTLASNLTKIIESAANLWPQLKNTVTDEDLLKYVQTLDEEAEFLESGIRKLLVLSDVAKEMSKLREMLNINDA